MVSPSQQLVLCNQPTWMFSYSNKRSAPFEGFGCLLVTLNSEFGGLLPPVIPLRCFFVYFTFVLHDLDYCSLAPHHGSVPCPMKIVNKDWLLLSLQLSTFISLFITYIQHLQVGSESFALPSDSHRINLHNFSSHAKPTSLD